MRRMRTYAFDYDDVEPEGLDPADYAPTEAERRAALVPPVPRNAPRDAQGFVLSPNRDQVPATDDELSPNGARAAQIEDEQEHEDMAAAQAAREARKTDLPF